MQDLCSRHCGHRERRVEWSEVPVAWNSRLSSYGILDDPLRDIVHPGFLPAPDSHGPRIVGNGRVDASQIGIEEIKFTLT
jgi:hypothetical protein